MAMQENARRGNFAAFLAALTALGAVSAFLALLTSTAIHAHHSTAVFNKNQLVSVSGVVTDWYTGRPHHILTFVAVDESGEEKTYTTDFGGRNRMVTENGWDETTFKPGDKVSVTGNPSRMRDTEILVETLTTETGEYTVSIPYGAGLTISQDTHELVEHGLASVDVVGSVIAVEWSDPRSVVYMRGAEDGSVEREYEVRLPGATQMYEVSYLKGEEVTPGTPFRAVGLLAEEGDEAIIFAIFIEPGDRGLIGTGPDGERQAYDYVGFDYTPGRGGGAAGTRRGGARGGVGAGGRGGAGAGGRGGNPPGGAP